MPVPSSRSRPNIDVGTFEFVLWDFNLLQGRAKKKYISNNGKRWFGNIKNGHVISMGWGIKIMCSISTLGSSAFRGQGHYSQIQKHFLDVFEQWGPAITSACCDGDVLRLEEPLFKTLQKCWPKWPASWPMMELDEAEGWRSHMR